MADLVTHTAVALLLKRGQRALAPTRPLHLASFVAGNLLPDLLSRLPADAFALAQARGLPVHPVLLHGFGPLHVPAGMALAALCLALLFPRPQQRAVCANLLSGMLLHLLLDLAQSHAGAGYLLLFPWSFEPFELGWIGSEATVPLAPLLALAAALAWLPGLRTAGARPGSTGSRTR